MFALLCLLNVNMGALDLSREGAAARGGRAAAAAADDDDDAAAGSGPSVEAYQARALPRARRRGGRG